MNVFISPSYDHPDKADGGIRRVVEAQKKYLPEFGINFTNSMNNADLVATHALEQVSVPTSIPWVLHCHGVYYQEFGWQARYYIAANQRLSRLLTSADYVTAPSEWIAQTLRRAMWNNPPVLLHGIDPEDWQGGNNQGYILWNKAREDAASNPEPLDELVKRLPNLEFVSTFGTPAPNLTLLGALPYEQSKEYTKNAEIYLSTAQETFGIGTLEAMAAGVPVVGWNFGGNSEIIKHLETGYLAQPGDYDDLIKGLEWAKARRTQVAKACIDDIARRWLWRDAIKRYAKFYEHILDQSEGPKVSVIIPCYNLGRFLDEAIESVHKQTTGIWELIIVDDASTDNTQEIVSTHTNLTYLRNEKNMHVSYTRNRGIAVSRGKYILCLDADDRLAPNCLELLSNALDSERRIHLAYGGLQVMSENGEVSNRKHEWPVQFDLNMQLNNENCVPTVCMFRRHVFDRTGGYRMGINPVEDADLWTRAAFIGCTPLKVTDETTFYYRLRGDSISRTMPKPRWDSWYNKKNVTFVADERVTPKTYLPAKIAVIIPVGPGHENIVMNAIDSVYLQNYQNWECIVINDTGKPIAFVPSWCKLINTTGNKGPAHARNLGIEASTALRFVPLDADDYLQPEALEVLNKAYETYGGVIYSQWYDQNDKTTVYDPPNYDARLLIGKGCIHAITALYPKDAWSLVGGFDESLSHWEDWDFQLALADKGICGTKVPMPLWTYRKLTGKRREENIAEFEKGKSAILAKWSKFWNGELPMACGGCSKGGGVYVTPNNQAQSQPQAMQSPMGMAVSSEEMTMLEFQGTGGARTYIGKATGTQYRFGSDHDHRVKLVHKADADQLLAINGAFRVYTKQSEPQLV